MQHDHIHSIHKSKYHYASTILVDAINININTQDTRFNLRCVCWVLITTILTIDQYTTRQFKISLISTQFGPKKLDMITFITIHNSLFITWE